MTVTVTYESLTTLVGDDTIEAATAEQIIDQAINKLVLNHASVDNLTGDAESKTGTYTQAQAGAILELAVAIYTQTYKAGGAQSQSYTLGGVSTSQSASTSSGASSLQQLAKDLANELISRTIVRT